MMPLDEIISYERNARLHPPEQIEQIAASMRTFGFTIPALIAEDKTLIAGHGRVMAARKLVEAGRGEFSQVPVMVAAGWSEAQRRAYTIADNRLAETSAWDPDLLRLEIGDLQALDFDLPVVGFDDQYLKGLFATPNKGKGDPDATPEAPEDPVSKPGDVWMLGSSRVACAGSDTEEGWRKLFAGSRTKASLVFTDPPYGVSYQTQSGKFDVIQGDKKRDDDLYKLLVAALKGLAKHAHDTAAFYIWHASSTRRDFEQALAAAGIEERQYLIWAKPSIVLGHADYHWAHEPCFYASKVGSSPAYHGDRTQQTVWRIALRNGTDAKAVVGPGLVLLDGAGRTLFLQATAPKGKKKRTIRLAEGGTVTVSADETNTSLWEMGRDGADYQHPTQKPVALAERAIENSSKPGDLVLDAFLGSGTTLIAAERLGRHCYGLEIDPKYTDVIVRRWQAFSGKEATLADTEQTFAEVEAERKTAPRRAPRAKGKASVQTATP